MTSKDVLIFLLGAAVGVAASWKIAHKRAKKETDEDVASVKTAYGKSLDTYRKSFDTYRSKVVSRFGKDVDEEFCTGIMIGQSAQKYTQPDTTEEDKKACESIIATSGYSADSRKTNYTNVDEPSEKDRDLPYVIKSECFGEFPKWGRRTLRFDKYEDEERLYDEYSNEDEDIRTVLGDEVIEYIDNMDKYDDSSEKDCTGEAVVYVRDDVMHVDYMINIHIYV